MKTKVICGQRWVSRDNKPQVEVCAIIDRGQAWELVTGYYDPNQGETIDSIPEGSWWNRGRTGLAFSSLLNWAECELTRWAVEAAGPDIKDVMGQLKQQHDILYAAVKNYIDKQRGTHAA